MTVRYLQEKFQRIGASLKVDEQPAALFSIGVECTGQGEVFRIVKAPEQDIENLVVIDCQPDTRRLLLLARLDEHERRQKFLCGHDQRHWFVAEVPEVHGAATVQTAIEALEPAGVHRVPRKAAPSRRERERAYVRQGEWFFIPAPGATFRAEWVRCQEPLGPALGSKPPVAEYCVRLKGETVYVCEQHPRGLSAVQYEALIHDHPGARRWSWTVHQRKPRVYVKGRVRHPDHSTIVLQGWHRVVTHV